MKSTCSFCKKTKEVAKTDDGTKVCKNCLIYGGFTIRHTDSGKKIFETALDKRVIRHLEYWEDWRTIPEIAVSLSRWSGVTTAKLFPVVRRLHKQGQLYKQKKYRSQNGTYIHYYKFRKEKLE